MTDKRIFSRAEVATQRPARYGKQLVSHLSRRSPGSWDETNGTGEILFDGGHTDLVASPEASTLVLELNTTPELVDRLEDVLGRHLARFATHDQLDVLWQRSDGTTGTRQSSDDAPVEHGRGSRGGNS